jgi:hypothetical protein
LPNCTYHTVNVGDPNDARYTPKNKTTPCDGSRRRLGR